MIFQLSLLFLCCISIYAQTTTVAPTSTTTSVGTTTTGATPVSTTTKAATTTTTTAAPVTSTTTVTTTTSTTAAPTTTSLAPTTTSATTASTTSATTTTTTPKPPSPTPSTQSTPAPTTPEQCPFDNQEWCVLPKGYTLPPAPEDWNAEEELASGNLVLGGLFPMTGRLQGGGVQREAGARLAVETINEEGTLLPGYDLKLLSFTTQTDEKETVRRALDLTDKYGVLGMIGAAASGNSQAGALIADIYNTPMMSYSSTSVALSDKLRYPTFFRTVPSDALQSKALADLCKFAGWQNVVVLHSGNPYGIKLNEGFQAAAAERGLRVVQTISILTEGTRIDETLRADMDAKIDPNLHKVFVLLCLGADAVRVLQYAPTLGLDQGKHTFLAADGVMQSSLLNLLAGPDNSPTQDQSLDDLSPIQKSRRAQLTRMARGLIGSAPSTGESQKYEELKQKWWSLDPNQYAGSGDPTSQPNTYMPYAYDCVLTYAHALSNMIKSGTPITPGNVKLALANVTLDGVTGPISFDENFDRQGAAYGILNFQGDGQNELSLVNVGVWQDVAGDELQFKDGVALQWSPEGYSTAPPDTIDCEAPLVAEEFQCKACSAGEYYDETGAVATCSACGAGQDVSSDGKSCQLTAALIILIVVVVVLVAALLVAGIIALVMKKRAAREREQAEAANAPPNIWDQADEMQELSNETETASGVVNKMDKSSLLDVHVKNSEVPMFGLEKGIRMPVDQELTDQLVLTNKGSRPIKFEIFVPNGDHTFECDVKPGNGVVQGKQELNCKITFRLLQTMKLDRRIKVLTDAGAVYFPLRFEGEVSQRLDPDEIELFGKPIGDGAFGTVYRGRYRGTAVAVKVLRRQNELGAEQNNNFLKEISLFQKLRNPYIVNFTGASYVPGKLCICTELLERGTVLELIQKAKISLALKIKLMLDTACAVEFLHENGVLYRDLKPDNLLVFSVSHNANVNCKLSDFGTARTVEDPAELRAYSSGIGTPIYMAPELMNASKYNCKVDVYSFAMCCWELMAEKQPFHEVKRVWDLPRIVVDGLRPTIDDTWPRAMQRMIADCWMQSQERRPTMKEAVKLLRDQFEKERKNYEKSKKAKKKDTSDGSASGPQTAHTGNLEELIERGQKDRQPIIASEIGVSKAEDVAEADKAAAKKAKQAQNGDDESSEYSYSSYEYETTEEADESSEDIEAKDEEESSYESEYSYETETETESEPEPEPVKKSKKGKK